MHELAVLHVPTGIKVGAVSERLISVWANDLLEVRLGARNWRVPERATFIPCTKVAIVDATWSMLPEILQCGLLSRWDLVDEVALLLLQLDHDALHTRGRLQHAFDFLLLVLLRDGRIRNGEAELCMLMLRHVVQVLLLRWRRVCRSRWC